MAVMLQPSFLRPRFARTVRRYRAHAGELEWSRGENLLPVDLKVTDNATKGDALPYSATADAKAPANSELCLKADKSTEKATIEIAIPSVPDPKKIEWRIVNLDDGSTVWRSTFYQGTPPTHELSLGNDPDVKDEVLFEVQVGLYAQTFTPTAKVKVRLVRDRLNWWMEPLATDMGWRTSKPEPRDDTGDYATHKTSAYKRESLESIYTFLKETAAAAPPGFGGPGGQPKSRNWIDGSVSCFGDFLEKLKTRHNNQLADLTTIPRLDFTGLLDLGNTGNRLKVCKFIVEKQTKVTVDANPLLVVNAHPERVTWANTASTAIGDARVGWAELLALWQKEGSLRTMISPFPVTGALQYDAPPPSTADEARLYYTCGAGYTIFGTDAFFPHKGAGTDNYPDMHDYAAAQAHFFAIASRLLGAGAGATTLATLTVTQPTPGTFEVSSGEAFHVQMLKLAGKLLIADYWQPEGVLASYGAYNQGTVKMAQMRATIGGSAYPERGRLGLDDWGWHYEVRDTEWASAAGATAGKPGVRPNVIRFMYYRDVFAFSLTP